MACFRAKNREHKRRYYSTPNGKSKRNEARKRNKQKPEVKARLAANRRAAREIDPERFRQIEKRASVRTRVKMRALLSQAPRSKEASEVWAHLAVNRARSRAKKKGWDFDLMARCFLPLPTHCPVFGIELRYSPNEEHKGPATNSASLDRVDSGNGYTQDNVRIISHRANSMKADASIEEIEALLDFMYRHII